MVSGLLITLALLGAPEDGLQNEAAKERPYHAIAKDVRSVIREEARAKSKPDKATAIHRMTDIFTEIKRDSRLSTSDTLKSYKAKLWSRLTRIKKDLEREFGKSSTRGPRNRSSQVARRGVPQSPDYEQLHKELTNSLASQLELVGSTLGGPGQVFAQGDAAAARGGRGVADHGPELVDLIERTIAPDFWDTNGGPGTIFYFKPLFALVVTATGEVHHKLGGVMDGLRRVSN